jgi:hypothetical protein
MPPLQLHILASDPATAARIESALQAGDPGCSTQVVADSAALLQALGQGTSTGGVALAPAVSRSLRHELNNHLGLIRMLADILSEAPGLSPLQAAKAREIGEAAEAAATAIRVADEGPAEAG